MSNIALGESIRARRTALGLSREKLAYESGVSTSTIFRLEVHGEEPKPDNLAAIATRLGLAVTRTKVEAIP
jgi:transcriptional regulator with XRE-family HTH domain